VFIFTLLLGRFFLRATGATFFFVCAFSEFLLHFGLLITNAHQLFGFQTNLCHLGRIVQHLQPTQQAHVKNDDTL
jgi:hypothetical protein